MLTYVVHFEYTLCGCDIMKNEQKTFKLLEKDLLTLKKKTPIGKLLNWTILQGYLLLAILVIFTISCSASSGEVCEKKQSMW